MDNFIAMLNKKRSGLSSLEKQVFDFMIKNPEIVVKLKVNELAKELYVSTATITRTAQKLGLSGYQELKYQLAEYQKNLFSVKYKENSQENFISQEIKKSIESSFTKINLEKITLLVEQIKKANFIEIFAVGGSMGIGIDLAKKLLHLGYKTSAKTDWDDLLIASETLTSKDLAIIISQSGETIQLLNYVNNLKKTDTFIASIIANDQSAIEELSDLILITKSVPFYYLETDLSSRVGLLALCDVLAIELVKQ